MYYKKSQSKEKVNEFRDAFNLLSPNSDRIVFHELIVLMHAFGIYMPSEEVELMLEKIGITKLNNISRRQFFQLMRQPEVRKNESFAKLKDVFRIFEKEPGIIEVKHMKKVLQGVGDKLSEKEFEYIVNDLDVDDNGKVNILDLVSRMRTRDASD